MPSSRLILCHLLLLLPSIFPSIRVFSSDSVLRIRLSKCWSFNFSISASSDYSGSVSFRIDWFDLPVVQGTLKSLLQHHSSKASILWRSASFMSSSDRVPVRMELTVLGATTLLQAECWRVPTSFREAGCQPESVRSTVARLSERAFASQTIHVSALPCKLSQ